MEYRLWMEVEPGMNWTLAIGALIAGAVLLLMGTRSSEKSLLKPWFYYIGGFLFTLVFLGVLWPKNDRHRYDPTFGLPKEIASSIMEHGLEPPYDGLRIMEGWTWSSSDDGWTVADVEVLNTGDKAAVDFKVEVMLYDSSGEYIGSMSRRFLEELPPGSRRSFHIERLRPKRAHDAKIQLSEIRAAPEERPSGNE